MREKELQIYNSVLLRVKRLKNYPEVMSLLDEFLAEVCKQVGEAESSIFATVVGDALYNVMEDHGWVDDDVEVKREIQEAVNKSVKAD